MYSFKNIITYRSSFDFGNEIKLLFYNVADFYKNRLVYRLESNIYRRMPPMTGGILLSSLLLLFFFSFKSGAFRQTLYSIILL